MTYRCNDCHYFHNGHCLFLKCNIIEGVTKCNLFRPKDNSGTHEVKKEGSQ